MRHRIKMKTKASSILEYAIVLGVIALALSSMQYYFRRSIQSVIKVAADEIGDQKKGAVDYDYKHEWVWVDASDTVVNTTGEKTSLTTLAGAVSYGTNETGTEQGLLSWGVYTQKE